MMRRRPRRPAAAAGAAALAAILAACAAPVGTATTPAPTSALSAAADQDAEQSVDRDIEAVARLADLDQDQAEAVIARQRAIGEVVPTIESILGDANAGISADQPEHSTTLHVRVAGSLPDSAVDELRDVQATLQPAGVTVKVTEGLAFSVADLTAAAEAFPAGGDGADEIVGVGVDVATNGLLVDVTRLGAGVEAAGATIAAGIPVAERLVTPVGE